MGSIHNKRVHSGDNVIDDEVPFLDMSNFLGGKLHQQSLYLSKEVIPTLQCIVGDEISRYV